MSSVVHQRIILFSLMMLFLLNIIESTPIENVKSEANDQKTSAKHATRLSRLELLGQLLHRRSFYDPAFESWSDSFDKKRNIFDPAYGDWSNTFKRQDE